MNSEIMKLKRSVEAQGFTVDLTENSHMRWTPPNDGKIVISTRSPGGRDMANLVADLKRSGYKPDEDLKREVRRKNKINKLCNEGLSPWVLKTMAEQLGLPDAIALQWRTMTNADYELLSRGLAADVVDAGLYEKFLRGTVEDDAYSQFNTTCKKCNDKTFNTLFARYKHEDKCGDQIEEPEEKVMGDQVPCPDADCDRTFRKSNPTSRLNHMQEMHNITECPNCCRVMQPSSLDRHLSEHCPVLHQGAKKPIKRTRVRMDATPPLPPTDPFLEDKVIDVVETKSLPPAPVPAPVAISPPPVAPVAAPVPASVAPTPTSALATDDDTMWALLEMVVDGPVVLNREMFEMANEWMNSTKKLREFVSRQRSS